MYASTWSTRAQSWQLSRMIAMSLGSASLIRMICEFFFSTLTTDELESTIDDRDTLDAIEEIEEIVRGETDDIWDAESSADDIENADAMLAALDTMLLALAMGIFFDTTADDNMELGAADVSFPTPGTAMLTLLGAADVSLAVFGPSEAAWMLWLDLAVSACALVLVRDFFAVVFADVFAVVFDDVFALVLAAVFADVLAVVLAVVFATVFEALVFLSSRFFDAWALASAFFFAASAFFWSACCFSVFCSSAFFWASCSFFCGLAFGSAGFFAGDTSGFAAGFFSGSAGAARFDCRESDRLSLSSSWLSRSSLVCTSLRSM